MNTELLDIVDENNIPTGEVMDKKTVHEKGFFHRTVHTWLVNDRGEMLLQLRSHLKDSLPDYWDISSAGHVQSGETYPQAAVRELKEELGVTADENDLIFICDVSYFSEKNNEFAKAYVLRTDLKQEDFTFPDREVEAVRYIPYRQLREMIKDPGNRILVHNDEEERVFEYIEENIG
ncbi:MAG: NUDIX domain-containing protein [Erysipelotrichaceae bacterium]|nr:NUDIX domain-containing protein [Erysipelotrichaceae bacterium]